MPSNRPMTVKQLLKFCQEEIEAGHGDCSILLSDDDEGNGYHYCWYSFTMAEELLSDDECSVLDYVIDEEINPISKTIILG